MSGIHTEPGVNSLTVKQVLTRAPGLAVEHSACWPVLTEAARWKGQQHTARSGQALIKLREWDALPTTVA